MAKNRTELVAEVAEKSGKSQATVNAVLDAVFQVFETSVSKGEKITIPGWLAIERTDRAARTGRNPQTGETHPDSRWSRREADRRLQAEGSSRHQEEGRQDHQEEVILETLNCEEPPPRRTGGEAALFVCGRFAYEAGSQPIPQIKGCESHRCWVALCGAAG